MSTTGPQQPDSQLRRRREQLAEEVAELHWNLGGLAYEMAIRDHFRLDVLIRRAAMLQERDAELAEVERMLHMQESGSAGNCSSCGAVRSRGAVFCWQCGVQVMERASVNGNFGKQDPPGGRMSPTSPVAAPADRDLTSDSQPERGGNDPKTHPLDTLAGAPERDDRAESQPTDDLARPVQTRS
jgi:hypothetical protein